MQGWQLFGGERKQSASLLRSWNKPKRQVINPCQVGKAEDGFRRNSQVVSSLNLLPLKMNSFCQPKQRLIWSHSSPEDHSPDQRNSSKPSILTPLLPSICLQPQTEKRSCFEGNIFFEMKFLAKIPFWVINTVLFQRVWFCPWIFQAFCRQTHDLLLLLALLAWVKY